MIQTSERIEKQRDQLSTAEKTEWEVRRERERQIKWETCSHSHNHKSIRKNKIMIMGLNYVLILLISLKTTFIKFLKSCGVKLTCCVYIFGGCVGVGERDREVG